MEHDHILPWRQQAVDAVEAAYKAGYAAGHQAAMTQIMQAVQVNMPAAPEIARVGLFSIHAEPQRTPNLLQPALATGRAPPGYVKKLVRDFVLNASGPVTEHKLGELHPQVNRSSRYMAFRSLESEGVIVKQDGAWVPAAIKAGNPGGDTPG
jgi:hypothetical protein